MATNPFAEKRRLRKLENQRLEEEAKRRQEELRIAHEREQQRIENERAAEQQRQLYERERVRLARQAELDRIARLEREEHAVVSRIETQLSNVGAFCAGELVLSDRDAVPLSLAVFTPSALETPIPDAPETDTVVFVADTSSRLHAFSLSARAPLFSASLSSVTHAPSAMPTVCSQNRQSFVTCLDLRVLFKLYRTAAARSNSDAACILDGAAALAFAGDDAVAETLASPRGIACDDTARELFVSDQLRHCVTVFALAPDTPKPRSSASSGKAPLARVRSFGSKGHGRAQLQCPNGLDVSHYHVVVCDTGNNRLAVFAKRGSFVCSYGSKGTHDGAFHDIRDVKLVNVRKRVLSRGLPPDESTVSTEQFEIVVADLGNFRIHVLTETGAFVRQLSLLGTSEQIAFQRSQLNALHTALLREFATLAPHPTTAPKLNGSAMAQVYALARQLHPSCQAYARITTAQAQWRDVRARFHHPLALAYAPSSRELVFVDHENASVLVYNADGSRTKWLGLAAQERRQEHQQGRQCPVLSSVHSVLEIAFTISGAAFEQRMYVSDPQSHRVAVFRAAAPSPCSFLFYIGAATYGDQTLCSSGYLPGELQHPTFLACVQPSGGALGHGDASTPASPLLVVSDTGNHSVSVFDAWSGQFHRRIGAGFGHLETYLDSPLGIAVLHDQWLYVCDQRNHRVQVFDLASDGSAFKQAFGREGTAAGELRFPTGIAVAAALPRGDAACDFGPHRDAKVVVSDSGNRRVQVFGATDLQVLLVLDVDHTPFDQPLEPLGACIELRSGCILVCDGANKCVLIFRRDGAFIAAFGSTVEPTNRFARPVSVAKHDAVLLVADAARCDVCVFELR